MKESLCLSMEMRRCIFSIKGVWNLIFSENTKGIPLQGFDYYKWLCFAFYAKHFFSRWRILFFYLSNGINECIIPLVINERKRLIRGLSSFGRLDYEDVITTVCSVDFLSDCIKLVLDSYKEYDLHLINVNENSSLYKVLGSKMSFLENGVVIDLPNSLDDYLAGLSKHQRQNIRTAYNKLDRDSFEIHLKIYRKGSGISHELWRQCQRMYEHRHNSSGPKWKVWMERQINPYTHILQSVEGWCIYVLFHGDTPISYMAGLLNKDETCFYVPRLCIDNDYYQYSPGIILLVEVAKHLIAQDVSQLDLMLGDEPYKIAMGGRIHKNYELKCSVNELFK